MSVRKIITQKNKDIEPLSNLIRQVNQDAAKVDVSGLNGAARPFLVSLLFERLQRPLLVVCPEEKEAVAFARDLILFSGQDSVFHYPSLDFLTVDMFALQKEEELTRLEALANLQVNNRTIIVTSVIALMQKVMPVAEFNKYLQIISAGDTINRDDLCLRLISGGYKRASLVEEKGEFSIRGNIIDIFPPTEKNPLRLEMLGDEIESIRMFDGSSQRSIGPTSAFIVPPAGEVIINPSTLGLAVRNIKRRADDLSISREIRNRLVDALQNDLTNSINPIFLPLFYETYDNDSGLSRDKLSSLFDYLAKNTLVVLDNPLAVNQAIRNAELSIDKLLFKTKNSGKFYLEKENAYIDPASAVDGMGRFKQISLEGLNLDQEKDGTATNISFETYQYLCAGDLIADEIKEDAYLRWTAEKIKFWLSDEMLILFSVRLWMPCNG